MSSSPAKAGQSMPAFFLLKTEKNQYVVKGAGSNDFKVGSMEDGASLFQMTSASEASDGLVLLQTLGGRLQVPADPSLGVVLRDASAPQVPFLKVPVGDAFALGTPDKEYWLSVSDEGKLVFSKLTGRGMSETFTAHTPPLPHLEDHCCGPSLPSGVLPSKAMWNADGHKAIVQHGIESLRSPLYRTSEATEFIIRCDRNSKLLDQLFTGLPEADDTSEVLCDWSVLPPYPTYASHFYDPDNASNYLGFGSGAPTAMERGRDFFNVSLKVLASEGDHVNLEVGRRTNFGHGSDAPLKLDVVGDREAKFEAAFRLLGVALHYFTDLSQPMHAANIPNTLGSIWDWRHSKFEEYADIAVKGLLQNNPRLSAEELDISNIGGIYQLYDEMAREAKKAWVDYIKPLFEKKTYLEKWGNETDQWQKDVLAAGLKASMGVAPARVARFLVYWIHLDLKRLWDNFVRSVAGRSYGWALNNASQICAYSRTGAANEISGAVLPGAPLARAISVGSDGSMWALGYGTQEGGFLIYYLASEGQKWVKLEGQAAAWKVAVAPDGGAYVVNSAGKMWALTKPDASGNSHGDYISDAPLAREISISPDGGVWIISRRERERNFVPYHRAPGAKEWMELKEAAAMKVAAAPDGTARALTFNGEVWSMSKPDANGRSLGTKLSDLPGFPGSGREISVTGDGTVWVTCSAQTWGVVSSPFDSTYYLANGANKWERITGGPFLPVMFAK